MISLPGPSPNAQIRLPLFANFPSEESAGHGWANLRCASSLDNPAPLNQATPDAPHGSMESPKPPGRNASARPVWNADRPSR